MTAPVDRLAAAIGGTVTPNGDIRTDHGLVYVTIRGRVCFRIHDPAARPVDLGSWRDSINTLVREYRAGVSA